MDEAAPLLHVAGRLIEISEILLSLSAGAILLIATLLRNPPQLKRANWHIVIGLAGFTFSLLTALGTIAVISNLEGVVLRGAQEAMLLAKSDTSETGKPALVEPRAEPETQDNEKETEKQAETSRIQIREPLIVEARIAFLMTFLFFGLGLMSMLTLGLRIAFGWEDKPAPSS